MWILSLHSSPSACSRKRIVKLSESHHQRFQTRLMAWSQTLLAGLALLFSSSLLLQILACALYNNWWPMLSALMYILVPMPCMFFSDGTTQSWNSRDADGWINAAKFLTGASMVGSLAIPIILRHADFISTGAMLIEFISFFIFLGTIMCYYRANTEDDWSAKESSLLFTL